MTPSITSAVYIEAYRLRIAFADGKTGDINLERELWGEMFEPLKNLEVFKQFRVDPELNTIVWPNGADLAPEFLYQNAA
jgi:Protein of unknown function (DUF2442)